MQESMNIPNFRFVNKAIIEESLNFKRFGPVRYYRLAYDILKNVDLVDKFMLSEMGGFTQAELNRIKRKIKTTNIIPG